MKIKDRQYQELEANYFARCLLMPEGLVRRYIDQNNFTDLADDQQVKRMAEKFNVPLAVAVIRINELGMAS